ncbi:carboxymuconolactone decarboxylase family protein [Neopusillimonas maritima]|jgi:AhpD family alkylhydroperoxidase|uniref:Alkylhydroperoxidase n=1 Tax=Neopusillimonas maritima TaxID=2026239 RepID=A0ABX9MSP3_9BURK|nr:carboxymuconolactone decarboxylase family protein [Neopusillimonas maritima]MAL01167.1 alkylhydroperoxidase [Alcaligenaceae bacterium]RII81920.1 alkylhydroperoxidase [Neopusillimonas maritima]
MEPRLDYFSAAPEVVRAMMAMQRSVDNLSLERGLVELVKIRASQLNGCAYCIHMHTTDARKHGESEMRLYLLSAWRESPLYSKRERAALEWTETLTLIAQTQVPDDAYALLNELFSAQEQVELTLAITTINAWNRFAVGFRAVHPV